MALMTLQELIDWLEKQPRNRAVLDGFGRIDSGDVLSIVFEHEETAMISDMLESAYIARGCPEEIEASNPFVHISYGKEGVEPITRYHLRYWEICEDPTWRERVGVKLRDKVKIEELKGPGIRMIEASIKFTVSKAITEKEIASVRYDIASVTKERLCNQLYDQLRYAINTDTLD